MAVANLKPTTLPTLTQGLLAAILVSGLMISSCTRIRLVVPRYLSPQHIDALMPRLLERHRVPGVAVALVRAGEVTWTQGYGIAGDGGADVSGNPVTADTLFQVASLSKPVAAWGVMKLVEQGQLELDTPINQLLETWTLSDDTITVRHLLSHTAGLSVGGYYGSHPEGSHPEAFDVDVTTVDVLNGSTPGDGAVDVNHNVGDYRYSGGGYTVLQLLIEEVTGEPFADYMARAILEPLTMTTASFVPNTQTNHQPYATGFDKRGEALPFYRYHAHAAASLTASVQDMGRFVAASVGENPVLSPETVRGMLEPSFTRHYGLGYALRSLASGDLLPHHYGNNRGWHTYLALFPEGGGLVILSNSDSGKALIEEAISTLFR